MTASQPTAASAPRNSIFQVIANIRLLPLAPSSTRCSNNNPRARAPARSPNGELLPAAGPAFFRTNSRASGKAGAEQSS